MLEQIHQDTDAAAPNAAPWPTKWNRPCANTPSFITPGSVGLTPTKWTAMAIIIALTTAMFRACFRCRISARSSRDDKIYQNTRRCVLSADNPYYCQGTGGEGPGGPHAGIGHDLAAGPDRAGLTSTRRRGNPPLPGHAAEHPRRHRLHARSFDKDDPAKFTRPWFAWANTIFGELVLKLHHERPHLLD